jgi:hypothetical protein
MHYILKLSQFYQHLLGLTDASDGSNTPTLMTQTDSEQLVYLKHLTGLFYTSLYTVTNRIYVPVSMRI